MILLARVKNRNFSVLRCCRYDWSSEGGGDMTANRFESQLREGVKELECLYSLTRLVEESENSVDKILQGG